MNRIIDFQPLLLTPLAPIHIGSGEELDWTRAVLDGRHMVIFDPLRVQLDTSKNLSPLRLWPDSMPLSVSGGDDVWSAGFL
jgi:hypothetical protein